MPAFTSEELEVRRSRVGASEVAAIVGLDPYRTPLDIWLDKLGMKEPRPESQAAQLGLAFEPVLVNLYLGSLVLAPGTEVHQHGDGRTSIVRPNTNHACTPDRLFEAQGSEPWGLELKMRNWRDAHRWGETGTADVPEEVAIQCQWSMYVTDRPRWDVTALIGGNDLRVYTLTRDPALIDALRHGVEVFWTKHVVPRVEPPMDGSEAANAYLKRFPHRDHEMLTVSDAALDEAAEKLTAAKAHLKVAEKVQAEAEQAMKLAIGEHEGLVSPAGWRATWKATKSSMKVDWEEVAQALAPVVGQEKFASVVEAFTEEKPGHRRFLFTSNKE